MSQTNHSELGLLDLVPSADHAPPGARASAVRKALVKHVFGRRALFKGLISTGMAAGVASLDLIPRLTPRAAAVPATWDECSDYARDPNWDPRNYWNICNPCASGNPPISNSYCNGNGYHRIDTVDLPDGYRTQYFRRLESCKTKNAWVWRISNDTGLPNPRDRRCSDGRYRTERYGSLVSAGPTVCQELLTATGKVEDNRTITC
ncbi:hypothetical protein GCM10027062_01980 [Nocardioides hungaricus]